MVGITRSKVIECFWVASVILVPLAFMQHPTGNKKQALQSGSLLKSECRQDLDLFRTLGHQRFDTFLSRLVWVRKPA